jgi:hypothetical protein
MKILQDNLSVFLLIFDFLISFALNHLPILLAPNLSEQAIFNK